MDLKKTASELSEIEKGVLLALKDGSERRVSELKELAGLNIDSVRRAVGWLGEKELVAVEEDVFEEIVLTEVGKKILEEGLPEKRMLKALEKAGGKAVFGDLLRASKLDSGEFNAALGMNKKLAYVTIAKGEKEIVIELSAVGEEALGKGLLGEKLLEQVGAGEKLEEEQLNELFRRHLIEKQKNVKRKVRINGDGKECLDLVKGVKEREHVLEGAVKPLFIGKKQPYNQFLAMIRKKLVEMGFQEMPERLITQEFYNFDVLFQPQNHPARNWSDTYQLRKPTHGKLLNKEAVRRVKEAHEKGEKTSSIGWRYEWSEEVAKKVMPTSHGTTADSRKLCEGAGEGKYFVINRCYRPDVLDATHLVEFNQLDGLIVGKDLSFKKLLGILKKFSEEIAGAEDIKFTTGYFPFTEPSCEISIKHPKLGWIEIAGGGVLRPEITEPLGIKEPALAWGMGIDRLAMCKLGIKDIRYLFSQDLNWLRKSKIVSD